jgi:hypothetical protein
MFYFESAFHERKLIDAIEPENRETEFGGISFVIGGSSDRNGFCGIVIRGK